MGQLVAYVVEVGVASLAAVLLIFLACSRTLDFASSMELLELATVDFARVNEIA